MLSLLADILFDFPEEYVQEATGIIDGMKQAGVNLFADFLNREIGPYDILACNTMADITSFACSSISAWGDATASDSTLGGETALCRNLDWARGDNDVLSKNAIVIGYQPSNPNKRRLAIITVPGFIGCLSCMSESGVAAELNQSDDNGATFPDINFSFHFMPINFTMRKAMEDLDFDGDGIHTINDIYEAVKSSTRLGRQIIMAVQPNDGRSDVPGFVIENDNKGTALRYGGETTPYADNILAATNHFRVLAPPVDCWRFEAITQFVLAHNEKLTLDNMWEIMDQVKFDFTIQTIRLIPATKSIEVAFTFGDYLSPQKKPISVPWDELFSGAPESDDDTTIKDDDLADDDNADNDDSMQTDDDSAAFNDDEVIDGGESEGCGC